MSPVEADAIASGWAWAIFAAGIALIPVIWMLSRKKS